MGSDYTLEMLGFCIKQIEDYGNKKDIIVKSNTEISKKVKSFEVLIKENKEKKDYYSIAVNELYEEHIKSLQDTLNLGLQTVIYDRNLGSEFKLEDKRGTKTLNISIIDNDTGELEDIKDGNGMGIATIISFVLKVYYLLNKGSKILLLDEKYSAISEEYVDRFFNFMKQLVKDNEIAVVLISHDNRFSVFADNVFQINRGNVVKLVK